MNICVPTIVLTVAVTSVYVCITAYFVNWWPLFVTRSHEMMDVCGVCVNRLNSKGVKEFFPQFVFVVNRPDDWYIKHDVPIEQIL